MRTLLQPMTPEVRRGIYQTKVSPIPSYCPRPWPRSVTTGIRGC